VQKHTKKGGQAKSFYKNFSAGLLCPSPVPHASAVLKKQIEIFYAKAYNAKPKQLETFDSK